MVSLAAPSEEASTPSRFPASRAFLAGRERLVAVVLVLVALAPIIVLVVTRVGYAYTPASDIGNIDLRVREVWSLHPPLVGPYGNRGWDHPGPLLFYLLALPSMVSGFAAWGTQVGAALLQGVAVVWLARLVWRRGGLPLVAMAMLGISLLEASLPTSVLRDPWNPHVAVPFFALFIVQAWLLATGDARALPGATAVATFLVQTHIGYAPFIVAAAAVVVVCRVIDHRASTPTESWTRPVRWSVVVLAVLWLPPVLDTILHWPGNLYDVASYFAHPARAGHAQLGLQAGARLMAAEFRPWPEWLRGHTDFDFIGEAGGAALRWLLVPVVAIVVGMLVARRRRDTSTVRFLALAATLLAAGIVACSRLEGPPLQYLVLWRPVLAIAVALGVGWALFAGSHATRTGIAGALVGIVLVTTIVAASAGSYAVAVRHGAAGDNPSERATAALAAQLRRHGVPRSGVILRLQWTSLLQLQRGLYDELARHDLPVFVDESQAYQYPAGLAKDPHSVGRVWWVAESGRALTELSAQPGATMIASWSPLPKQRELRARTLSDDLYRQFEALHRPDLVADLDNPFLGLLTARVDGVDHDAANELSRLNIAASKRGGPRCGVVSFAPSTAPAQLARD